MNEKSKTFNSATSMEPAVVTYRAMANLLDGFSNQDSISILANLYAGTLLAPSVIGVKLTREQQELMTVAFFEAIQECLEINRPQSESIQ